VQSSSYLEAVEFDRIAWSVRECACVLGYSERTTWTIVRKGHLSLKKLGSVTRRVSRNDLVGFLEGSGQALPPHKIELLGRSTLNMGQVARVLGLGSVVIARLVRENGLPVERMGYGTKRLGRGAVKMTDLVAWLQGLPALGESDFRDPVRKGIAPNAMNPVLAASSSGDPIPRTCSDVPVWRGLPQHPFWDAWESKP